VETTDHVLQTALNTISITKTGKHSCQ